LKEYLKAQSKTNEIIVGNSISSDELDRFSKSDFRWADNRKKAFRQRSVKKGEIYQFEFGKNYIPEKVVANKMAMGIVQAVVSIVLGLVSFKFLENYTVGFIVVGIVATWSMAQYNYTFLLSTFKAIKAKIKGNQSTNSN